MRGLVILGIFMMLSAAVHSTAIKQPTGPPLEITSHWIHLFLKDGIRVEYKVTECQNSTVNNQVLVLFRFTNTSSTEIKTMRWNVKQYRNDSCSNCDRIGSREFQRSVTLSPGEILEGDGTSKMDKRVYIFAHFIELVPGMSEQRLTDFEFVDVSIENNGAL
jgi:hypothetical protein